MEAFVAPPHSGCSRRFILQMWTSVRSLQSLRVSISVSTVWAPSAASVTPDTSCRDTAAWVSRLQPELKQ